MKFKVNRFRKYLLAALGVGIVVVTLAVLNTRVAFAQGARPVRDPVQATIDLNIPSVAEGLFGTIFTVPAGKRLVIEYASMLGFVPGGQTAFMSIGIRRNGTIVEFTLPMSQPAVALAGSGSSNISAGQKVQLYVDNDPDDVGSETVFVAMKRTGAGAAFARLAISGYLIDLRGDFHQDN